MKILKKFLLQPINKTEMKKLKNDTTTTKIEKKHIKTLIDHQMEWGGFV